MKKHPHTLLHFYRGNQHHTTLGKHSSLTLVRAQHSPLAEQQRQLTGSVTRLLATDIQGSVLQAQTGEGTRPTCYTAFGHHPAVEEPASLAGFNGQRRDPSSDCYLLGNGYRAYNGRLMRFHSPDSLSPFAAGGINAYAYCAGDPLNRQDPSGHMFRSNQQLASGNRLSRSRSLGSLPASSGRLSQASSVTHSALDLDSLPGSYSGVSSRSVSIEFSDDSFGLHLSDSTSSSPGPSVSRASNPGPGVSRGSNPSPHRQLPGLHDFRADSASSFRSSQLMEVASDISATSGDSTQQHIQQRSGLAADQEIVVRFENPDETYALPTFSHLGTMDRANRIRRTNAERVQILKSRPAPAFYMLGRRDS